MQEFGVDDVEDAGDVRDDENGRLDPAPGAPAPVRENWFLEPHICRSCHSRLASTPDARGRRYECTNCGLSAVGVEASVLCCCGMTLRRPTRTNKTGHHLVDAGIRCMPNPEPTPEFPSLFIAAEVGK